MTSPTAADIEPRAYVPDDDRMISMATILPLRVKLGLDRMAAKAGQSRNRVLSEKLENWLWEEGELPTGAEPQP